MEEQGWKVDVVQDYLRVTRIVAQELMVEVEVTGTSTGARRSRQREKTNQSHEELGPTLESLRQSTEALAKVEPKVKSDEPCEVTCVANCKLVLASRRLDRCIAGWKH